MSDLGRLEQVPLRDVWTRKDTGFSRWLSEEENLRLLSDTVGLELALENVEQNVGPFRADVLCKATGNSDHWVLIENQIERTDHSHLGQLLTYAAGLHTATIIWIAQRFTEEHRAALDWLNEVTNEEISFFGLEIELWRIANSPAAPKFNIVSKPNEWVKQGSQRKERVLSERGTFYNEYWQAFCTFAAGKDPLFGQPRKSSGGEWISWGAGKSGLSYVAVNSPPNRCIRVRFAAQGNHAKSLYNDLTKHKPQVDGIFPGLIWRERPEARDSYIDYQLDADPENRDDWPSQHRWLLQHLQKLRQVFSPLITSLE